VSVLFFPCRQQKLHRHTACILHNTSPYICHHLGSVSSSHEGLYLLSFFPMLNSSSYRSILPEVNHVLGAMSKIFQMFFFLKQNNKKQRIICNFHWQNVQPFKSNVQPFKSPPSISSMQIQHEWGYLNPYLKHYLEYIQVEGQYHMISCFSFFLNVLCYILSPHRCSHPIEYWPSTCINPAQD